MGEHVSGVSHVPIPTSGGLGVSKIFAHPAQEIATTFRTTIELDVWKILHGRPRPLARSKFLVARMLTRDLFAVVDLLVTAGSLRCTMPLTIATGIYQEGMIATQRIVW